MNLHPKPLTQEINTAENGKVETAVPPQALNTGLNKYQGLFEATPVSLWEEDFSLVKQFIDQLRQKGVTDFKTHFDNHPQDVYHCINLVKVLDINQTTLKLYKANNKQEILQNLETIFGPDAFQIFRDELVLIGNGETLFEAEGTNYTLEGEALDVFVRWSVPPGYEETLSQVIVSILDITARKQAERKMRLQTTALESIANAIVITDNQGKIHWANAAFTKLTGYNRDEIVGQTPRFLNSGQNDPALYKDLWGTISSGQVWHCDELINKRKDGSFYHEQMTITPVKDENGIITQYIAFKEDISQRKQMETQLRRQLQEEELLRKVIALTTTSSNLTMTLANVCQEMAQFFNVPKSAFALLNEQQTQSKVIAEYRRPDQPSSMGTTFPVVGNPSIEYLLHYKVPLAIRNAQQDSIMAPAHDVMKKLGIISILLVPVFVGDQIVGTIGIDSLELREFGPNDIALGEKVAAQISHALARQQAEQKIQEERDLAYQVMDNMGQGLVLAHTDWTIEYCNPALAELLGIDRQDIIGRSAIDLVHNPNPKLVEIMLKRWLRGNIQSREMPMKHADGSIIHTLLSAVPRWRDGQVDGAIAVITDLTQQKTIEKELANARDQAVEASRLKSEFLANMSHEIRTPLNAVIGMTSLLLDMPLNNDQRDFAETIRSSGDVLLSLINDILDFSKIEAGKLELEKRPFDLRDCVEEALDVVVTKAAEKGLEIAYIMEEHVPQTIIGDVTRLRQVMVNLLNNAIKFTETGEVVLKVSQQFNSSRNGNSNQQILHFAIQDTGIGIPEKRLNKLFKSFSQVDSSTTRRYGGTGLGLAISKSLVEMMGGTIWVESEVKKGSIFQFTIQTKVGSLHRRIYLHGTQPQLAGKRLLIVDDNETNRHILTKQAQSWGMKPQAATSGPEALVWLQAGQSFDLAILDMQMPVMDGLTLAGEIRRIRDEKTLPLVMLSSIGDREGLKEEAYFAAYLTKPIKPKNLFATLTNLFSNTAVPFQKLPQKREIDPNMGHNHPLHILLAEDNLVNQKVALRILERMGYRADVAANGLEVLESLQRQQYDVVLMDVQMPNMDGVEATQQIRDIWPPEQQPAIIAMTANALTGDREKYLESGMDDYISKPVRIQELLNALANAQPRSKK